MMKIENFLRCASFGLLGATLGLSICPMSALAQETTGAPGFARHHHHDRRETVSAAGPEFGGVIKQKAADSQPWWAPRVVPPKGAPNVLLIMTDDQGFGAPSTFGGVVVFDYKSDGPELGKGGTGVLSVDGKEVATNSLEHGTPVTFREDESFEHRYDAPFKFTGKIDKLTIKLQ